MKSKVYAVYDSKAQAFMAPFQTHTRGMAIRMWTDTVNDEKTQFHKHPGDFTLFELGEYDDENGKFENKSTPESCGLAVEFIQEKNQTL